MKQYQRKFFIQMHLLIVLLVIVSCRAVEPTTPTSSDEADTGTAEISVTTVTKTLTPPSTPSITSTATSTPATTSTVLPTETLTLPTIQTSTPEPIATLTPLPIIPPERRGEAYQQLMINNGNCALPCFWGVELGVSTLDEVRQLYESFEAFIVEDSFGNGFTFLFATFVEPMIEDGVQVRHTYLAQNEVVIEAEIQLRIHPSYQIEPLLRSFGKPDEIWMWTIPNTFEGVHPADFLLYYSDIGALVGYRVNNGIRLDNEVQLCFDEPGAGTLLLWVPSFWDPNGAKQFVDRANDSSELTLEGHLPIAEVSNWDVAQFHSVLSDSVHTNCLETPTNLWSMP